MASPPIELILYLEPSAEFKQAVDYFLETCSKKYGPTTANKYDCHITMTGFFNVANEEQQNIIKQMVDNLFSNFNVASSPKVNLNKSLLIYDSTTNDPAHLLLSVTVPDAYHSVLSKLANACKHIVKLRLKKINHISLAYWDEPEATLKERQVWQQVTTEQHIFECIQHDADENFQHVPHPTQWDVVLYTRISKGRLVGQKHKFKELGRWTVYR